VTPQDATQEKIYKVGDDVTAPVLVYSVDAEFPKAKQKAVKVGWQGISVLEMVVDRSGNTRDIHVKQSLAPDFDKSAIDAASQYKFKPAMHDGRPVAVSITVKVNFRKY
jgi:periplasmic protein TonB